MQAGITNHALATAHLGFAHLELRLDEGDELRTGFGQRQRRRQHLCEADERRIADDDIEYIGNHLARQVPLEFDYRGKRVKTATRLDLVVNGALLLQVRAQEAVTKLEEQQFESVFKLSKLRFGLLVNFNVLTLRKGIRQIMRKRREES